MKSEYYQIIAKLKLHLSPSRDQLAEIISQLEIAEANSKFVEPDFWLRQFEVFQGLSSKNLNISNLSYPQNLIFNLKNDVLIFTLNFKVLFEDP